ICFFFCCFFFFQAEDGIRDFHVTGVQTCALPISARSSRAVVAGAARSGRAAAGGPPPERGRGDMSRVIAVANQKGGVAKTTTVANLGAALHEAGYRVLLGGMDPPASLTVWSGRNPDALGKTTYDALIKGLDSREILLPTPMGPDLLPANIDLSLAEIELIHTVNRERRLAGMLAPLRDEYDFVLMDCQPSLGLLTVNAFAAADEV